MRIAYQAPDSGPEAEMVLQAAREIWQRIHFLPGPSLGIFIPFQDMPTLIDNLIQQSIDLAVIAGEPDTLPQRYQHPEKKQQYELEIVGRFLLRGPPESESIEPIPHRYYCLINYYPINAERSIIL